ncbi:MAG: Fic family protein [Bifidobacteriaceae bacterium]|jgi:Fic family protein|nr:Fic family protein [Bifidobacteriaceae bacterium]
MQYSSPGLGDRERTVIAEIEDLRGKLRHVLHEPSRWVGSLRRLSFARNLQNSNDIEGYRSSLDDAAAIVIGEDPRDLDQAARSALEGYRDAMTYVIQRVEDEDFSCSVDFIKGLHFMMTNQAIRNRPGRWRAGAVYVTDSRSGEVVHTGADVDEVPVLMEELVDYVNTTEDDLLVKAALVHLNLAMIHPFRDGNGRMARCLQSFVLAAGGLRSPIFMSIEEYLGEHTRDYYQVLSQVGRGSWQPSPETRPWIRFNLTAHLRQAKTLRRRTKDFERLWMDMRLAVGSREERQLAALSDAATGLTIRRATYLKIAHEVGEEISDQTAGRDLKALTDEGLLEARGEKRGRYYVATEAVAGVWLAIRKDRDPTEAADPFA